jgi:hypothetical protein
MKKIPPVPARSISEATKLFNRSPIGLPHPRRTTHIHLHTNAVPPTTPTDTALRPPTQPPPPPPTTPLVTPLLPHIDPPCVRLRKGPLGRVSAATISTAKSHTVKSHTSNTAARQIPPTVPQQAYAESQPREQGLWTANIRRGQTKDGDEEVSEHDEPRGHVFVLVLAQQVHTHVHHYGTSLRPNYLLYNTNSHRT